jgi:YHS domain-containing protein
MTKDPVCGKEIDEDSATIMENYEGHEHYFCSQACKDEFNRHPDKYSGEGWTPGIKYPMGFTPA